MGLLFYNVPAMFLAAGAAPALGALCIVALADGTRLLGLLPVLMSTIMGVVFCLGRALETPSQQQSDRRLNGSLHKFEVLAENVPDMIARLDLEGRYLYVSPASLAVLGFAPAELVGTLLEDRLQPEDGQIISAVLGQMMAAPTEPQFITAPARHKDGRLLWMHTSIKLVHEDGVPVGVIGVSRDVTERVEADAALQAAKAVADVANRVKSEFLANISHELRTPLNGVLGVLHLLKQESLSEPARRLLTEAVHCGAILAEQVNAILDLSEMEAGRLELQSEVVDGAVMIEGVSEILRPQIEGKGLRLDVSVDSDIGWTKTDPVRLRQILFNLMGNAAKFTHHGSVSVRVMERGAGDSRRLRFEIVDTGVGMSEATQSALFAGFHQRDGSATREFGGTGIGLVIARTLVERMDGEIGVQSAEGEGSTFWIELPAPPMAAPEAAGEEGGWLEGLRILLVEDNPTNRLIATHMLESLGACVETAENGALGVEAMQTRHFDVVFMDIQMPVMDGISATKAIRALPAPACRTPIIAVTANAMLHQVAEYTRVGMNGLIAKPLSPSAIIAEIAKFAA
jgi:PAS domain S-box-containing protein